MRPVRAPWICIDCYRAARRRQNLRSSISIRHGSVSSPLPSKATRPLRVGIIGSGPAGFYAAARILKKSDTACVDVYEKLPVPFGLVRYGVAPDHPEVKNCEERFEQVAESERFTFIGNAEIGSSIPLSKMKVHYDALLFAYGAAKDRKLGIPGEELDGVYSARAFVGWYNGLPEHRNFLPNLDSDTAVVIGHGNVALDVARILLTSRKELARTDISEQALEGLSESRVQRVVVAGRRGPMQGSFTIKEIRELMQVPRARFLNKDPSLIPTTTYISQLPRLEQRKYRMAGLLKQGTPPVNLGEKHWELWSMVSPTAFEAEPTTSALGRVSFRRNDFADPNMKFEKTAKVVSSDETSHVDTSLAFTSIGYQSIPLPGLTEDLKVQFNSRVGVIPHDGFGRAISGEGELVHGCYCTGWVKNGPTGVIATTMDDAFASADSIVRDWESGKQLLNGKAESRRNDNAYGWTGLREDVQLSQPISWTDWKMIDQTEVMRGREYHKPREKFTSIPEMLGVASGS
ncbi:MAG: NADPH-adrenodoxin reductase [Chrysothrix sp. TS-e1954]|nr:MAG: NADPH-adrenodoxin reductase [Chrysothrix sp. TS-e1954]